jgi:preprotein translocase subunit YajC
MKKIVILIFGLLPFMVNAQNIDSSDKAESNREKLIKCDTVYLFGGDKMYINVKKISFDSIIYTETNTNKRLTLDKDKVHKIRYNWGKLEYINEEPVRKKESLDWREVKIVKNKINVKNKYKIEEIEAPVKGNSYYESAKILVKKAEVILRKKAANLNANYVLITNKTVSMAFGEIPSATLTGIAYSDKEPTHTENKDPLP